MGGLNQEENITGNRWWLIHVVFPAISRISGFKWREIKIPKP